MADRWSNPSGSVGQQRFRVWPAGTDSYDHVELAGNLDKIDAILGIPSAGAWPPTEGVDGGIYALIKDLQDRVDDIEAIPPPTIPSVSYGTTLPGSPSNGQEAILVDSTTNPSYQWRFRYNSGASGTYKWEFCGGFPHLSYVATTGNIVGSSYEDLDIGTGPDFTAPLAGEYSIQVGCNLFWYVPVAGVGEAAPPIFKGVHLAMSYTVGGLSPQDDDAATAEAVYAISNGGAVVSSPRVKTVASSGLVRAKYRVTPTTSFSNPNSYRRANRRWMLVTPKRVSS